MEVLKSFIKLLIFICIFLLVSCINCEKLGELYIKDECVLVVQTIPEYGEGYFNYTGIQPYTKQKCNCKNTTSYRWWSIYSDKIEIGDTIIKKKGELTFNIHKKDTILSFNWECEGKVYK